MGISQCQYAEKSVSTGSRGTDMTMPMYRKLLLTAATAGIEMLVAFGYLYQVPLLQRLGVPITYLSLYPLVTGPANMIILNLFGRLIDKGSNHKERKVFAVVVVCFLCLIGVVLILFANLLTLSKEKGIHPTSGVSSGSRLKRSSRNETESPYNSFSLDNNTNNSILNMSAVYSGDTITSHNVSTIAAEEDEWRVSPHKQGHDSGSELTSLPLTGVLGLLGQATLDMGCDLSSGTVRACVLACSDGSQHTVLLVLALVLAAVGGCALNLLGLLDLSPLLSVWGADQESFIAQATVLLVICGGVLILTTASTVLTALLNIRSPQKHFYTPLDHGTDHLDKPDTRHYDAASDTDEENENEKNSLSLGAQSDDTGINIPDQLSSDSEDRDEHSDQSKPVQTYHFGVYSKRTQAKGLALESGNDREPKEPFGNNDLQAVGSALQIGSKCKIEEPFLNDDVLAEGMALQIGNEPEECGNDCKPKEPSPNNDVIDNTAADSTPIHHHHHRHHHPAFDSSPNSGTTTITDGPSLQNRRCLPCNKHKLNFIAVFVCGCLSMASFYPFAVYSVDFLGKVVMGGDSTAPPDCDPFRAYSQGVSLGAGGLLVFFSGSLVISIVHGKLLDLWGLKADFCLAQVLTGVALVAMMLTTHLAAYYVSCLLCSFQRAVFYTVPFIIASDYAREQEKAGEPATGRTLAILTCMSPISTCVVFTIGGPLISLTHYPGAPLVMSAVCSALAAVVFCLMYTP